MAPRARTVQESFCGCMATSPSTTREIDRLLWVALGVLAHLVELDAGAPEYGQVAAGHDAGDEPPGLDVDPLFHA